MKRTAIFFVILGVALAALYYSERRERSSVSPNAMLEVAADIQRDLTRAPMHFTRTSDEEEIKILHDHYCKLVELAKADRKLTESHSVEEAEDRHEQKSKSNE